MVDFAVPDFAAAFDCAVVAQMKHDSSTAVVRREESIANMESRCYSPKNSQEKTSPGS